MYIDVLPLIRLPRALGTFTYRVPEAYEPRVMRGSYVRIPFRSRTVWGIVTRVERTTRPPSNHALRDLLEVRADFSLSEIEVSLIERTANLFRVSPASVAYLTQPHPLTRSTVPLPPPSRAPPPPQEPIQKNHPNHPRSQFSATAFFCDHDNITAVVSDFEWVVKLFSHPADAVVLARTPEHRMRTMQSIARAVVARGRSLLVLTPHRIEIPAIAEALGAIASTIVLDRQSARGVAWTAAVAARRPGIILIGTRAAAFTAPLTLGAIVLDGADSDDLKQWDMEPKYDARRLTAMTAAALRIPRILLSPAPRVVDWGAARRLDIGGTQAIPTTPDVVDLDAHWRSGERGFLTPQAVTLIERAVAARATAVVIHNRKGRMRRVVCADCHTAIACASCGRAVPDDRDTACASCGAPASVPEVCPSCQSVRLRGVSVGTAGIADFLVTQFPTLRIARVDGDRPELPTGRPDILVASQRFLTTIAPTYGGPVGGMLLLHAEQYARADDYRAQERLFQAIRHLMGWSVMWRCPLVIQSSAPERIAPMVAADVAPWYREELAERRALGYPPYTRLVRCDTVTPDAVRDDAAVQDLIIHRGRGTIIGVDGPYSYGHVRRRLRTSILIRCRPDTNDAALVEILRALPHHWQIDVDPVDLHA